MCSSDLHSAALHVLHQNAKCFEKKEKIELFRVFEAGLASEKAPRHRTGYASNGLDSDKRRTAPAFIVIITIITIITGEKHKNKQND